MSARNSTSVPTVTNTSASRIAQQWGIDTLASLMSSDTKRRSVAKRLGITPAQLQQGMQQLVGYTSHSLSIPVSLTGVPRIDSKTGRQNYGRPPAGQSAPSKTSKTSKTSARSKTSKTSARKRPTVAARNRAAKRSASAANAASEASALLAGVTTASKV